MNPYLCPLYERWQIFNSVSVTLWTFGVVVYRVRGVCICICMSRSQETWVGVGVCMYVNGCVYICIWLWVDLCVIICVYPYRGLNISAWVLSVWAAICILWMNHSSTGPSRSGNGQIKLRHDLKDFNLVVTLFFECPENIQTGNIFMSCL